MRQAAFTLHANVLAALRGEANDRSVGGLVLLATLAIAGYGAAMGSFGALYGGSMWQIAFAAIKSPLLIGVTFGLTLPSFVVLHLLLGLRQDLRDVIHSLLSAQVAVAVTLLSVSPLTLLWYLSVPRYESAILFNAAMFALASVAAQRPLRARYRPLIRRNPLHGRLLRVWLGVYAFVGIQMGWVLRPFIGKPFAPAEFLRPEKWDNAYVIVAGLVWRTLFGSGF
ncbi:MAG TPA: hypothetical protein VF595_11235 [Tepidisphaeraceae bacterium]|jgi:hypothetical protein